MTRTETARRAVGIAHKLSPAMRLAVLNSAAGQIDPATNGRTLDALITRGIVGEDRTHYFPRYFLTDLGRIVHAVLLMGADDVVAYAERQDAQDTACTHRCKQGRHCGGCGCPGCGYSGGAR